MIYKVIIYSSKLVELTDEIFINYDDSNYFYLSSKHLKDISLCYDYAFFILWGFN